MGGHAAGICAFRHLHQLPLFLSDSRGCFGGERVKIQRKNEHKWTCYANTSNSRQQLPKNQRFSTFSLSFNSDVPLRESPGAVTFDDYLNDPHRLVKAIFPGKCRKLEQDEWRVQIPPIELLFLQFCPVIYMQLKSKSKVEDDPSRISKVLELHMIRWEILGVDSDYMPNNLDVCVRGAIFSERKGLRSSFKNQMMMSVSFVCPNALAYVPKDVIQGLLETVLKKTIDDMKKQVNNNLLLDYRRFKKEKQQQSEVTSAICISSLKN